MEFRRQRRMILLQRMILPIYQCLSTRATIQMDIMLVLFVIYLEEGRILEL